MRKLPRHIAPNWLNNATAVCVRVFVCVCGSHMWGIIEKKSVERTAANPLCMRKDRQQLILLPTATPTTTETTTTTCCSGCLGVIFYIARAKHFVTASNLQCCYCCCSCWCCRCRCRCCRCCYCRATAGSALVVMSDQFCFSFVTPTDQTRNLSN